MGDDLDSKTGAICCDFLGMFAGRWRAFHSSSRMASSSTEFLAQERFAMSLMRRRQAYESGGESALLAALQELLKDPVRCTRVIGAYYPEKMREALKDAAAAAGVTIEDLRDLLSKSEGSRH